MRLSWYKVLRRVLSLIYDGRFSIMIPAGKKLVVSYIGMVTQTVAAKDGMKVVLSNDNHQLNEVVVTGMTQQDKRLFSGAATKD